MKQNLLYSLKSFIVILLFVLNLNYIKAQEEGDLYEDFSDKLSLSIKSNMKLKKILDSDKWLNHKVVKLKNHENLIKSKDKLKIKLFGNKKISFTTKNIKRFDDINRTNLIYNEGDSYVSLYFDEENLNGFIDYKNQKYRLRQLDDNQYVLLQVDLTKVSPDKDEGYSQNSESTKMIDEFGNFNEIEIENGYKLRNLSSTTPKIKILFFHTSKLETEHINEPLYIKDAINEGMNYFTEIFNNSNVNINVENVHPLSGGSIKFTHNEFSGPTLVTDQSMLNSFVQNTDVIAERLKHKADICVLLVNGSSVSGLVNGIGRTAKEYGFCFVQAEDISNKYSLQHEFGHILGAWHQHKAEGSSTAIYPGKHGFTYTQSGDDSDSDGWRSVMAIRINHVKLDDGPNKMELNSNQTRSSSSYYDCNIINRIKYFSNPNIQHEGIYTGSSDCYVSNTLNNFSPVVENYVQELSGTLSSNTTWTSSNYYIITNDFTIPAGVTLTINAGAEVFFESGKEIIVNGTLNVNGSSSNKVTFDRLQTTGNWDGITFNSGSSGNINFATIKNANIGIYMNNSSPAIKHCTISNNSSYGIKCYNHSNPTIYNCKISNNGSTGVVCNLYSSPTFILGSYTNGGNTISNNSGAGIYASNYCNPYIGGSNNGYNSIYGNSNHQLKAEYGCSISAMHTWWGTTNPRVNYEVNYFASDVNFTQHCTSNPNASNVYLSKVSGNLNSVQLNLNPDGSSGTSSDLQTAVYEQLFGDKEKAILMYKDIIEKGNLDNLDVRTAIIRLSQCSSDLKKNSFKKYLKDVIRSKNVKNKEYKKILDDIENNWLLMDGMYPELISNLEKMLVNYKDDQMVQKNNLFLLGYINYALLNDKNKAINYFDELVARLPKDDLVKDIYRLTNKSEYSEISQNIWKENKDSFDKSKPNLLQNYPNPYNPVTTISYNLPEADYVTIKIYNSVGEEVQTLVNSHKEAGVHRAMFDGRNLASGLYIYTINVNGFTKSKKMLLIK